MNERPILEDINDLIYQEEINVGSTSIIQKIIKGISGFAFLGTVATTLFAIIVNINAYSENLDDKARNIGEVINPEGSGINSMGIHVIVVIVLTLGIIVPLYASWSLLKIFLSQVPKEFQYIVRRVNDYDKETKKELKTILEKLDKVYNCKKDLECIKKMAEEFKVRVKNSNLDNKKEIIKDIENFENITEREIEKKRKR